MILVDTTLLVCAVGSEHPLRSAARASRDLAERRSVRATTIVEVLQEFAHVRSRRRPRAEAGALDGDYAIGFGPLVRPDEDDLLRGLTLFGQRERLGSFDAVLAATALR